MCVACNINIELILHATHIYIFLIYSLHPVHLDLGNQYMHVRCGRSTDKLKCIYYYNTKLVLIKGCDLNDQNFTYNVKYFE